MRSSSWNAWGAQVSNFRRATSLASPRHLGQAEAVAGRVASVAKALADPIRVQVVDVLSRHAGEVCVCELEPLFDVSQPTLSHHLKTLRDAGVVGVERRGLWAYYYVNPSSMEALRSWLS